MMCKNTDVNSLQQSEFAKQSDCKNRKSIYSSLPEEFSIQSCVESHEADFPKCQKSNSLFV